MSDEEDYLYEDPSDPEGEEEEEDGGLQFSSDEVVSTK